VTVTVLLYKENNKTAQFLVSAKIYIIIADPQWLYFLKKHLDEK